MLQFVPMTDDMLEAPERLPGPLVPYRCGFVCWHALGEARLLPVAPITAAPPMPRRDGASSVTV